MSFADWSNKKKKKEEKENQQYNSFADYSNAKHGITEEEKESALEWRKDEIAPVKQDEERTWFKSGAFDDGYQFGDVTRTVVDSFYDVARHGVEGVVGLVEPTIDAGAYILGGVGGIFSDDFKDGTEDFLKKDLINEESVAKFIVPDGTIGGKGNLRAAIYKKLAEDNPELFGEKYKQALNNIKTVEDNSVFGEKSDSLVTSAGHLAGQIGLQMVGVPWEVTTGITSFGGGVENALKDGATYGEAGMQGVIQAGADILTEKLFRGSGLGEQGLINLSGFTKGMSNKALKRLLDFGIDLTAEGMEEVAAKFFTDLGSSLYKEENLSDIMWNENSFDEYLESFIGGAFLSGVSNVKHLGSSIKNKTDYRTGLNENDEKVLDKVFDDAVKDMEAEKGESLTTKEKNKLKETLIEKMGKGEIGIDTIEEVLGGDSYKAYKDSMEQDETRKKELADWKAEYDSLYKMKNMEKSDEQIDRQKELKGLIDGFNPESNTESLKEKMSSEVFDIAKKGVLVESYNERARKGEAFTADLSRYKGKQRTAVERAIKSGVLNNTNRSHELVDILSRIEADKGIVFDYTSNEKLKESGLAVEGKTVNGFVKNGAVTLNVQSPKAWQSTVGHEITHILEGTEAYGALQKSLFAYAKSKGELDSRRANLTELYKNIDADIDGELTADLVGDYLFNDKNFIRKLTNDRPLFQKLYDEVKYLCKVATGKELTEIEKVKREFDNAWKSVKGINKTNGKFNYSLAMVDEVQPKSDKWHRTLTTEEAKARFPKLWDVTADESEVRNPTQITSTVKSYRKIYDYLKTEGFNGTILDASSGLGYGTKAGIEEYGFNVEDIEPYPDESYNPKYKDYSTLDKKYDVVISNAVLNVLPQDQRDALVVKMGELLNDGGRMFINVRGKDVDSLAANKNNTNISPMEWFVDSTGSYQKGFTKSELIAYLQDALGEGYTVKSTNLLSGVSVVVTKDSGKVKYSVSAESKSNYAPTFYSQMGKTVDAMKQDKIGANSVVSYLKGRGVKDAEIKWSGIEAFLEGKKSVTKAELQEFIEGSQLQIEENVRDDKRKGIKLKRVSKNVAEAYVDNELISTFTKKENGWWQSDKDSYVSAGSFNDIKRAATALLETDTKWSAYKLDGGKNYREITFNLPSSTYYNRAMRGHWGDNAKGILAHARIQDFKVDGKKMLFIEEIQSDWHNAGHKFGYSDEKLIKESANAKAEVTEQIANDPKMKKFVNAMGLNDMIRRLNAHAVTPNRSGEQVWEDFNDEAKIIFNKEATKDALIEYYSKLREGIDSSKKAPEAPFSDNYHEFVLKSLIRNAAENGYDSIGWTPADVQSERWSDEFAEGYRIEYDQDIPKFLKKYGKQWGATVGSSVLNNGTEVWSMDITDEMKNAVLYEGQVQYSVSEDSNGNQLSKEQSEYFKDSKVVDENGNLKVMYHTTKNDFTVFDKERKGETTEADNAYMGFFFAESKEYMQNFPEFKGQKTDAYYLDMKNPIDMTNISKEAFMDVVEAAGGDAIEAGEIYDDAVDEGGSLTFRRLLSEMIGDYSYSEFYQALEPNFDTLAEKGYDGVINFMDEKLGEKEYIVFDSNQAKLITNTNPTTNEDTRYSLSSMANTFYGDENMSSIAFEEGNYKATEGYKNYVEQCVNNMRQTRSDFDETVARQEIEKQIDGIVKVALAAKKAGYDIQDDASKRDVKDSKKRLLFSSLEPNSDYLTSNDISTECDKRKNFADIYDSIVKREEAMGVPQGKRFFDNVDNYFYLHKVLADKGLTQPCRECYVESMRKNLAPMADAFLRLVNETDINNKANDQLYHQDGKDKGKIKSNNSKLRNKILETFAKHPEYNMSASDLTIETLTTEDGLAQLKIQAPLIYEAFNSFYGQSKPKMPKKATPFRFGELTALLTDNKGKIKQSLVNKINSTGGFRLQSYSDFQIQNFTDVLQVIYEAGTLGLSGHAYTKVPAFLKATEGTNLKRNISIFMYKDGNEWKLDKNDSFPAESLEEIYNIVNADESGNTGIIAVSQNTDMSCWIMANDNVAYGIPFHKSGLKMDTVRDTDVKTDDGRIVKGYSETIDHTKYQTEVWADTETKVKNGIDIYKFWDFDNKGNLSKNELIEKNVMKYIDECEKAGYLPKFRNYVKNNDAVLESVLNYSKELGSVPQDATIEDISFEYKGYTIPYGYYKFLGDFNMFKPDGTAAPHDTLSLVNYDFDKAAEFFDDAEGLRRNEILQQFANDGERQKYRDSNLTAEQLTEIVNQKRQEVTDSIVAPVKNSLSFEGEEFAPTGDYSTPMNELALAPTQEDISAMEGEAVAEENAMVEAPIAEAPLPTNATPKSTQLADGTRGDVLLNESLDNYPMQTVEQKIAENIRAVEGELADNRDLRREAEANYNEQIANLQKQYNAKKNKNTKTAYNLLQSISRIERLKASADAKFAKRISDLEARLEKMNTDEYHRAKYKQDKMQGYADWAAETLGDTTTWQDKKTGLQYSTNTEHRNFRDIVRDANGKKDTARADAIYDATMGEYNRNQAAKNRKVTEVKKPFADMNITKAESTYIQMLGELKYNPETTLTSEKVNEYYEKHKKKIDTAKVDKAIELARKTYDDALNQLNAKLREQGMKEIPYRQGYFPHFTEPKQNFIKKLFNWKTQDTEIPTSIAGLTEDFKPNKSWQSFDKKRHSDETDYNFLKGLDSYLEGAYDWIYHLEDIQKRRAIENHIRFTHSEEGKKAKIKEVYADETLDADEAQAKIEQILGEAENPLNNFVQDFMTHTNILTNKKNSYDRGMEQALNRKIYSTMTNVQNRISANMVLANIRSALTNFIPITQSWAQVSPLRSLEATKDVIKNAIQDDGLVNKSTFLTNRLKEAENLHKDTWDKVLDKAGIMFEVVDNFSSQVIWRSKYNDNLAKGMSESEAIKNADQFAENVMAGRSKGNEPTLFNAKSPLVKMFTLFQLEVNNQYGYFLKDVPTDLKTETNHWKLNLAKGYTTAFLGAYAYNALMEQISGSGAALDPIGIVEDLLRDLGLFDDDEEKELGEVGLNLLQNVGEELPFIGGTVFGGGRIPISSALPYGDNGFISGVQELVNDVSNGNLSSIDNELQKPFFNFVMPVGGGQLKKSVQGLKMFNTDEEHPIAGSYTDSGDLRFPVDDTRANRTQAFLFGQWANENARDYIENGRTPLSPKKTQEYMDVDLPIADYWKYLDGLKGLDKNSEKADYINSLDIEDWQKNLLMNNILDRDEDVDMSNYDDYNNWEEFDYAQKNPEKYAFSKTVGGYEAYKTYSDDLYDIKADKDINGKSISGSRKQKVLDYVNNLDADYETKLILFKSEYPSDKTYDAEIINHINNRSDLTYEERINIFEELGFKVINGQIYY